MWQNHDLESENILRNYTCVALWLNNSISSICLLLCTEKTSTAWGYQLCEEAVFIAAEEGKHLKRPSAGSWLIITMDFMAPPPSGAKAAEDKTWSGERCKNTLSSGKDETQNSARYNLLLKKKREKHTHWCTWVQNAAHRHGGSTQVPACRGNRWPWRHRWEVFTVCLTFLNLNFVCVLSTHRLKKTVLMKIT